MVLITFYWMSEGKLKPGEMSVCTRAEQEVKMVNIPNIFTKFYIKEVGRRFEENMFIFKVLNLCLT